MSGKCRWTKLGLMIVLAILGMQLPSFSQSSLSRKNVAGDWQGNLKVSGMNLRLVFHLSLDAKGELHGTLDSPDQGATGIPVSRVVLQKDSIRIEVAAIMGTFAGRFNRRQQRFVGSWHQGGKAIPLALNRVEKSKQKQAAPQGKPISQADLKKVSGIWQGVLKVSGLELHLVFKISTTPEGRLSATMDSPDQGARDIPCGKVVFARDSLRVEVPRVVGFFEGKVIPGKNKIIGHWVQGGRTMALELQRVEKEFEPKRPQEPKGPVPYLEEEVRYKNEKAGIELAGTFTRPKRGGPFPAVLLISGSGPQDRNETLLGHKPFWVLADYLTRRGIAVLRVDDRGVGQSSGDFATATTQDFASDALAGVNYLASRKDVNSRQIGLIGHSEGGLIAPMVAVQSPKVAFIVLMAGPGLPGEQILLLQSEKILRAMGGSEALIQTDLQQSRHIYDILKSEPDDSIAQQKILEYWHTTLEHMSESLKQETERITGNKVDEIPEGRIKSITSPWFRFFLTYDPRPVLRKVKCPVLAIIGEKDLQVPAKENLKAIEAALRAGGNRHYTIKELKGLNHLFQTAETGAPSEYGKIEETLSPKALKLIADWILQQTEMRK